MNDERIKAARIGRHSESKPARFISRHMVTMLVLLIFAGWFQGTSLGAEGAQLSEDPPPPLLMLTLGEFYGGSTDCDSLVGKNVVTQLFIYCYAGGIRQYTLTWDNPHFQLADNATGELWCTGGLFNPRFNFVATRPGIEIANITLTVADVGTFRTHLIGNAVVVETPRQWLAELPEGTYGWANILDQARELLYISDNQGDRVLIFSLLNQAVIATVPVGAKPMGMALSPDGAELYVANSGDQSISVIDTGSRQEVRRLRLPDLGPYPGYTPYSLAIVDNRTGFLGTTPPGHASGGPIYQFLLSTGSLWPRTDLGAGRNPQMRQSRDYEWTAILVEPYSSPTELALYDRTTDRFIRTRFGIQKQLAVSRNGDYVVTADEGYSGFAPDLTLHTAELDRIGGINLLGTGPNSIAFGPVTARWVYAESAVPDIQNLAEIDTQAMRQTRSLRYVAPQGFYINFGSLAVSDDGDWAYMILNDTVYFHPTSKILALWVRRSDAVPDIEPPTATILLPPYQNVTRWTVKWSGNDSASDIARFDVQYTTGASDTWNDWVSTGRRQAVFDVADVGTTYCFRVRALDASGNMGVYSDDRAACTIVDQQPPVAQVNPLEPTQEHNWWVVAWSGEDDISGIDHYELQVRTVASDDWVDWISSQDAARAIFRNGVPGESYCFRVRATDQAGNVAPYPSEPDTCTISGSNADGLHASFLPVVGS